jgi:cytochrome c peroxidase
MARIGILLFAAFAILSCSKEEPENSFTLDLPAHFPPPKYDLKSRPVTEEGFELGRKLFYDPRLSRNGTISCGNCHQLFAGFAHADHDVSHGIDDLLGKRNAQHLVNLFWQNSFFWDGGVFDLDLVSVNPITNPVEMDNKMSDVMAFLRSDPGYQTLFKKAYPKSEEAVTTANFLRALSQFMGSLISADSPYDQYELGNKNALSAPAIRGMQLFKTNCNSCHTMPLFTDNSFRSNGLPGVTDPGRKDVTLQPEDAHKFKVPSLRNLTHTGPYMHDGRFKSIEQVIEFYSSGIADLPYTDRLLYRNGQPGFQFSEEEKADLLAFLKSLTDQKFLSNPRFDVP